jgi:hypothetical protein
MAGAGAHRHKASTFDERWELDGLNIMVTHYLSDQARAVMLGAGAGTG